MDDYNPSRRELVNDALRFARAFAEAPETIANDPGGDYERSREKSIAISAAITIIGAIGEFRGKARVLRDLGEALEQARYVGD